jgi:pectinesterase
MRFVLCVLFIYLFKGNLFAQSIQGITNAPDTSFNINSEYRKLIKTYPGIKIVKKQIPDSIAVKTNIVYCKTGKRELLLDVFYLKRKSKNKRTAIIILYGGGWRSGQRNINHPLAEKLAGKNYVCITPEYRLSTEALYPAAVYDVKAAIRWVRKHAKAYNIDVSKIVIAGHSAGGQLAALVGTTNGDQTFENGECNEKYSSNVNAIIDIDGILAFIHPESGEGDDSKRTSAATYWFGYSRVENPKLWIQASPLTHVGIHTPPTLFLNSAVARMHAGRDDFINILNKYDIYSEVKIYENAPHSFCFFEPWFESMVNDIDIFLKRVFNNTK